MNEYKKNYILHKNGYLVLTNPEKALKYIQKMYDKLIININNKAAIKEIKLEIINDYKKICKYDNKNSFYPNLIGTFKYSNEKDLKRKKILLEDLVLYLGNIYLNFHSYILNNKLQFPIISIPKFGVDYNNAYIKAIDEYFTVLKGDKYPINFLKYYDSNINNSFINIINGNIEHIEENNIENIQQPIRNEYVYGTIYIIPALIEKFLIASLKTKLINKCVEILEEMINHDVIELTKEEQIVYNICSTKEHQLISENIDEEIYRMFVKYCIIKETSDNELIITGKCIKSDYFDKDGKTINQKHNISIGDIIFSNYAKQVINKEYLYLINCLFNPELLNLRNNIMHGNNPEFNYFCISISSVLIQLLWDITDNSIYMN